MSPAWILNCVNPAGANRPMGAARRIKWERRTQAFFEAFAKGAWKGGERFRARFRRATMILWTADRLTKNQA